MYVLSYTLISKVFKNAYTVRRMSTLGNDFWASDVFGCCSSFTTSLTNYKIFNIFIHVPNVIDMQIY